MDVYFYEIFNEEHQALKQFLPKNIKAEFSAGTIQELRHVHPPAKLISIRTQSEIPTSWADQIQGVLSRSQGFDHLIDYLHKSETKVPCGYLGDYCSVSVAEHAMTTMLMLMKRMKKQKEQFGTFHRDGLTGLECKGRNALVVGVGNIGSQIVDLARGFNMFVKGVDIEKRLGDLEYVSLESGVPLADVIFCALPLTEKTAGLLDYDCLRHARSGAIFINISRGEITPIEDLKQLLDENILGAISLDVFPHEKELAHLLRGTDKKTDRSARIIMELSKRQNVVLTPHNAFNTSAALERKAQLSVESVKCFLDSGTFPAPIPHE